MRRRTMDSTFAVGFLAVAIAVLVARANPATAYEPSIYAATPTATWVGFGVGLAIAVATAIACRGRERTIGIALGALTVTAIVSLPVIRSYRFLGMGDALTHLGWVRDIVDGTVSPHELFYPGVHSLATVFHVVGGATIERGLLLSAIALFVPFLVFVPLVVRSVTGNGLAVGVAAILSWAVLPINNIATHMGIHTNSNALFLTPVVIFAFVAYLRRRATVERLPIGISPFNALIYLTAAALLLVHPQQMFNIIVLLGVIAAVQFLARKRYDDHPMVAQPTMYAHTIVLGSLFTVWVASDETFRRAFAGLVYGLISQNVGAGAEVDQRESSLTEIGASLSELFAKLFLEMALIGLIVGLFVLLVWLGRTKLDREPKSFVTYFGIALVPLGGVFALYSLGTPTMAFRQVGFIYVVITILGGIAIARGIGALSSVITTPGANAVAAVFLGACLVLGLVTVYSSPLIYDPSQHVTEEQFSGYETGLNRAAAERPHVGLGYDPFRYDHGLNGVERDGALSGASTASGEANATEFNDGNYSGAYHGLDYYFIVTEWDETREIEVYEELRYSGGALRELETSPSADKVISNDEFRMYDVESEPPTAE
ncbi:hypothetical protein [Halosolutus gelatinilyticus]|uniref:hypothetical protein n=1 Tax=Halosolutus gelatinilyticus TaxID=2931975 RepID=UPI001FF4055C|nr:hypothetical protein [Halosolutus gelatinilyticus]